MRVMGRCCNGIVRSRRSLARPGRRAVYERLAKGTRHCSKEEMRKIQEQANPSPRFPDEPAVYFNLGIVLFNSGHLVEHLWSGAKECYEALSTGIPGLP